MKPKPGGPSPRPIGEYMELRWYQTYDKNGVDSEVALQVRHSFFADWGYVPFVREREKDENS